MTYLSSLNELARLSATEDNPELAVSSALQIVATELCADAAYLVYGTDQDFRYFEDAPPLELTRTALWVVNRELTSRRDAVGFSLKYGRVTGFGDLGTHRTYDYAAAILPTTFTTANMLIVRGNRESGTTRVQREFLTVAAPLLSSLLVRRLKIAQAEDDRANLGTLFSVGRVISESEELPTMLTRVARSVANLVSVSSAVIDMLAPDSSIRLRCMNQELSEASSYSDRWTRAAQRPDPIRNIVIATRQPMIFEDSQKDERIPERGRAFFAHALIRSSAMFPLIVKDEVVGILSLASMRPTRFEGRQRELIEGVTAQIAAAIKGVQLYEDRVEAEAALRRNQDLLTATIESTADGILVVDALGGVLHTNRRLAEMWRIPEEVLERGEDQRLIEFVLEQLDDPDGFLRKVRELYASPEQSLDTLHFRDGRVFERFSRPLESLGVRGRVWSFRDVTEQVRAQAALKESAHRYRQIFEGHSAVQVLVDLETGVVVEPNTAACLYYGYEREQFIGLDISIVDAPAPDDGNIETVEAPVGRRGVFTRRHRLASGEIRDVDIFAGVVDIDGKQLLLVIVQDITERKRAEAALATQQHLLEENAVLLERALESERERARLDPLTGTLNHAAIAGVLRDALEDRTISSLALAMVDVDGLKAANDTYGHQMGDALLIAVSEALKRDGAIVGRYGGDEFVAVLLGAGREAGEMYRDGVIAAFDENPVLDTETGARIPLAASIGIAIYPEEANAVQELIKASDSAMFAMKRQRSAVSDSSVTTHALAADRAARMVGEIVPFLTSPGSLDEKLRLVSQRLTTGAGYAGVSFALFSEQQDQVADLTSYAEAPKELIEQWDEANPAEPEEEQPLRPVLERTQRPVIIDDVGATPFVNEKRRTLLLAAGIRSAIVAPMVWQGKVVGTLSAGGRDVAGFGPRDAQFLNAVATQVTAIVHTESLIDDLQSATGRLLEAHTETVLLLASAAEAHDHSTGRHLQRVRCIAEAVARELGHDEEAAEQIGLAAVLHDIGKIRVPDYVLTSAGSLADDEWILMKHHTVWGAEFLGVRPEFKLAAAVARSHHERWDGSGYPDGLCSDQIPEAAAITSVADSLDAMTNDRPYRQGRPVDEAILELRAWSGRQFSPRVVDALVRLFERGELPGMNLEAPDLLDHSDNLAA